MLLGLEPLLSAYAVKALSDPLGPSPTQPAPWRIYANEPGKQHNPEGREEG